jgi:hypothetical protein
MGRAKKIKNTVKRPSVDWEGNDKALTWKLLELLKEHKTIRRGLWPGLSEKTVKSTKAALQRELAHKLLGTLPIYKTHVKEDPSKYGEAMKQKMER